MGVLVFLFVAALFVTSQGVASDPIVRTASAADGTIVSFYEYSPEGAVRGAPLLMFHQAGGDARGELGPIAKRLAQQGRRVFTADLRAGGDRFGGVNATAAGYRGPEPGYCDVYPDLEVALAKVHDLAGQPVVVVGSSYSAALVVRLAGDHENRVAGFVSFSPAGGEPMKGCEPEPLLRKVRVPGLAVRDANSIANAPWIAQSNRRWSEAGFPVTMVQAQGHGASLLLADRAKGDVNPVWSALNAFLAKIDRGKGKEGSSD